MRYSANMTAYKLLLLQPPVQDFYDTAIRLQPIGLCYLKAAVQKFLPDFQVVVKDYHQGWGRRTLPLPKELAYLKDYYAYPDKSPFSSFYHHYHFGASLKTLSQMLRPNSLIWSEFHPYALLPRSAALRWRRSNNAERADHCRWGRLRLGGAGTHAAT